MADSLIQPERWQEEQVPPCTVAYHFTLLDVNQELRFCCHGEKKHGLHLSLSEQWNDPTYSKFRKEWSARYKNQEGICLGCPHHEENKIWGQVIQEYLTQHAATDEADTAVKSGDLFAR
jgi:hypothetical protein